MSLAIREFHRSLGARFVEVNGVEAVADYGAPQAEHRALHETAGVLDLSFRSRLCLVGVDRVRFLHGQVTNDVQRLRPGQGCYAALVTAKGKMESDLNLFALAEEFLLDFEPGLNRTVTERMEKFIIADDVQVVDVATLYGLLSVQGPQAEAIVRALDMFSELPARVFDSVKVSDPASGEVYLTNHPRLGAEVLGLRWQAQRATALAARAPGVIDSAAPSRLRSAGAVQSGFDLFVPSVALAAVADKLIAAAKAVGGYACGWQSFETARIEAGIPRFGADMDETTIPLEAGLEARAVSYQKGCYIGQEVINRIHSIGHVNRSLRGLRLDADLPSLPPRGEKLFHDRREVGYFTSAVFSPRLQTHIALGYVRREADLPGQELTWCCNGQPRRARLVPLPFC